MDLATGKGPVTTGPVTIRGKELLQGCLELAISSAGGGLYFEPSHQFAAPFSDMRPNGTLAADNVRPP